MDNFWLKLNKPIYALAPLAGISDSPFRQMCIKYGADVVYSEMASVAALSYNPAKTLGMLLSARSEKPYVMQLFGSQPEQFAQAVKLLTDKKQIESLGLADYYLPQGFDINLGCPVPKVRKQTAGCALFSNLQLARQVIAKTIDNTDLPVSIKIRAKVGDLDCLQFLDYVADLPIKAVMIHGRSLAQGFNGQVDYTAIRQARNYFGGTLLANGGINNIEEARLMLEKTKADGLGVARGSFGRPWLFSELKSGVPIIKDKEEIFNIMLKQARLADKYSKKSQTNFLEIRKHLSWYVTGLPQAKIIRQELMAIKDLKELKQILNKYR